MKTVLILAGLLLAALLPAHADVTFPNPVQFGTTLPATCSPGSPNPLFFLTNGGKTTGSLYECSAPNTWTMPGGGGGTVPGEPASSVQFNNPDGTFAGNAAFIENPTALSRPAVPTLSTSGTPGVTSYQYRVVARNLVGGSPSSPTATVATGNASLDGTNFVIITPPACVTGVTSYDVYKIVSMYASPFLGNVACGGTLDDKGQTNPLSIFLGSYPDLFGAFSNSVGLGSAFPLVVTAAGSAFGSLAQADFNNSSNPAPPFNGAGTALGIYEDTADPQFNQAALGGTLLIDSSASGVFFEPSVFVASPGSSDIVIQASLNGDTVSSIGDGSYGVVYYSSMFGLVQSNAGSNLADFYATGGNALTAPTVYHFYAASGPGGSTVDTAMAFYSGDYSTSSATNNYYEWFDSSGVRRVKEDPTFNSVGQAIEALYNPQFTKYTPGAVDFERIILGEWESDVAWITTEAGGTGTLRNIQIDGAEVDLGTSSHLVNIPAATFKFDGKTCSIVATAINCS